MPYNLGERNIWWLRKKKVGREERKGAVLDMENGNVSVAGVREFALKSVHRTAEA